MILLTAIIVGLLAGLVRARYYKRPFVVPEVRLIWLAAVAFFPQWLAFFFAPTRNLFSDQIAAMMLVTSQMGLLGFSLANWRHAAFKLLTLGLLLNLIVILANDGLMPISPTTLQRLASGQSTKTWVIGQRVGTSKDRVLPEDHTNFAWLSDRFILPAWIPYKVAYSLGDVIIAAGACLFLWSAGSASPHQQT